MGWMIPFFIGMFVGGVCGGLIMSWMVAAKNADIEMERAYDDDHADTEASAVDDRADSGHGSDPFTRADRSRNGAERF